MSENYKDCLFDDKIVLKSPQRFKSYLHKLYTEEVNKIALNSNDDEKLHTFERITIYPYATNVIKLCESEILRVFEAKAKLKMLRKKCENEMYVKEKEKCEMFLK